MNDAFIFSALMLYFGPLTFMWGLRSWHKKRLIQNIPSSKIRSAAMGLVEIRGQARPRGVIHALLTQRPCCWWRYQIEEYRSRGKNSRWVTIATLQSPDPFFIEDETGKLLVDPIDAEIYVPKTTHSLQDLPSPHAWQTLTQRGIHVEGWWGFDKKVRVIEHRLDEHMPIYVLGELTHRVHFLEGRRERLHAHLRQAKQNPDFHALIDKNQDGLIDPEEWDIARKALEADFLAQETATQKLIPKEENQIIRKPTHHPFVICAGDEEKLLTRWAWGAPLSVIAGIGLVTFGTLVMPTHDYKMLAILGIISAGFVSTLLRKTKGAV